MWKKPVPNVHQDEFLVFKELKGGKIMKFSINSRGPSSRHKIGKKVFPWPGSTINSFIFPRLWRRIRIRSDPELILVSLLWIRPNILGFRGSQNSNVSYPSLSTHSLGLHKERPSYRRSLQPSKENI